MSANKTATFLAALSGGVAETAKPTKAAPKRAPNAKATGGDKPAGATRPKPAAAERHHSRQDRKHFGGYLDAETLEIAAVLRVRLKMDNSELIKFALEELDRTHKAKRAFGEA